MAQPRIVCLDAQTLDGGDVSFSSWDLLGEVVHHRVTPPERTAERLQGADIAITNKVLIKREVMEACPSLRLIAIAATGTNNVDLAAAKERGLAVSNARGYSTDSVAQHAITMLLTLSTQAHRYLAEASLWPSSPIFTRLDHPVRELRGLTLGIVGCGNIGERVGQIAEALGMNVQCLGRSTGSKGSCPQWPRLPLAEFLPSSDAISLHCPLTPETQGLINADTLGLMKQGAWLINTGRGELIDEAALLAALRSGKLGGAALDVLSREPPPADHPLLKAGLPNLLITPHTAWSSRESRQRLIEIVAENIRAFLATGTPLMPVP